MGVESAPQVPSAVHVTPWWSEQAEGPGPASGQCQGGTHGGEHLRSDPPGLLCSVPLETVCVLMRSPWLERRHSNCDAA